MVHPRATLTPRGRLLLVRRVEELSWPAAQVAEAAGVSRATVYKWLWRYRTEGQPGLQDRTCRPKRSPRALSAEQIARILKLRRGLKRGPHRLAPLLGHPRSTIYTGLRRHGCAGCVTSTASPGGRCDTSDNTPASWCTSTSRSLG